MTPEDNRLIGQLVQRVQDSIELANDREKAAQEWRVSIDLRLKPIEDWVNQANWSWKLMVGAVAFTGILVKSWDWVKAHFKG